MKFIRSFFTRIASVVASLFTPAGQQKALKALSQAESLVQEVMPVVESIAAATPNKTDDEVIAVAKRWLVPMSIPDGPLTDEEKGAILLQTAVTATISTVAAAAGLPVSVVGLAVQLSYTIFRAATRK